MARHSLLQTTLLLELQSAPAKSVTELASRVDKLRPSVSRSLKLLRQQGLLTYADRKWRITPSGQKEADRAQEVLQDAEAQLQRTSKALAPRISIPVVPLEALRTFNSTSSRMSTDLVDLHAVSEVTRASSAELRQLHAAYVETIGHALASLAQAQLQNAALTKAALGAQFLPDFEFFMQTYNRALASAIDDSLALRSLASASLSERSVARLEALAPISVHFPAITEAVETLNRELPTRLAALSGIRPTEDSLAAVVVPPTATAAYSRSIRRWIEPESNAGLPEDYPIQDPHALVHTCLAELNPRFVEKHQGAWNALQQGGPDSLRHAAVSMRELLRTVFKCLVPDEDLEGEGSIRLKARVRHLLNGSKSGAQFATHMALGLDGLFDRLSACIHGDETDRAALQGVMIATDGVLLFVLHHVRSSPE